MKKLPAILFATLMAFSVSACGGATKSASPEAPTDTPSESAAASTEATEGVDDAEASATDEESDVVLVKPEVYAAAVETLKQSLLNPLTYEETVELFGGVEGRTDTEKSEEGYTSYTWTDGEQTASVRFKNDGGKQTLNSITTFSW